MFFRNIKDEISDDNSIMLHFFRYFLLLWSCTFNFNFWFLFSCMLFFNFCFGSGFNFFAHQQSQIIIIQQSYTRIIIKIMIERPKDEGKINYSTVLSCINCNQIAVEPLISACCDRLVCRSPCGQGNKICPICAKPLYCKQSNFVFQIYRNTRIACPNECGEIIQLSILKSHNAKCPNKKLECPFCKEKMLLKNIVDHAAQKHQEESSRIILGMHKPKLQIKQSAVIQQPAINQPNPFKYESVNGAGKICILGRSVCGKPLEIRPQNSSIFSNLSTKQVFCSVDSGSCNKCMEQDCDRLALKKGNLLNMDGCLCKLLNKERIICGRKYFQRSGGLFSSSMQSQTVCNESHSCPACSKLMGLIYKGMYSSVI